MKRSVLVALCVAFFVALFAATTEPRLRASGIRARPLPTRTPDSNAHYTNAKPVPQGGALGGTTTGPRYAADAFHIDWDAFCTARPAHCSARREPHFVDDDARMVADTLPTVEAGAGVSDICSTAASYAGNEQCLTDVGVYYATLRDPLVTIVCNASFGCGNGPTGANANLSGARIFIPSGAVAQPGSDGHISIKQPSGVICQLWFGGNPHAEPIAHSPLTVGAGACGPADEATEGRSLMNDGGYAAGDEMSRGFLRPEDIVGTNGDGSDRIDPDSLYHALYGSFTNNRDTIAWPATFSDGRCKPAETVNGVMPSEGMYLYIDAAGFAAIEKWRPPTYLKWLKRALGSLHRHGMIDMDSSGCSNKAGDFYVNTLEWGSAGYRLGGGRSPLDAFLKRDIAPHDAIYSGDRGGFERAIYTLAPGDAYAFDVLWFEDVPGLSQANFHWIAPGCAELAVRGSSRAPC